MYSGSSKLILNLVVTEDASSWPLNLTVSHVQNKYIQQKRIYIHNIYVPPTGEILGKDCAEAVG